MLGNEILLENFVCRIVTKDLIQTCKFEPILLLIFKFIQAFVAKFENNYFGIIKKKLHQHFILTGWGRRVRLGNLSKNEMNKDNFYTLYFCLLDEKSLENTWTTAAETGKSWENNVKWFYFILWSFSLQIKI